MSPPSLRKRIRDGTLSMLGIALVFGILAVPMVHRLGGAIRSTLYSNYFSIKSANYMEKALYHLQVAQGAGDLKPTLSANREVFVHWMKLESHNLTEAGEAELLADIETRWQNLLGKLANSPSISTTDVSFAVLHERLAELAALNEAAMFRADSRANILSREVTTEFAIALSVLLFFGTALSLTIARNISRPLSELSDRLRNFNLAGRRERLTDQPLAELQTVAEEFNRMAERLEQFEKLNVDRIVREKNKTEAILESIEDGVILIDDHGEIAHINAVAAMVLGVERGNVVGRLFNRLDTAGSAYRRIRASLQTAPSHEMELQRVEVDAVVRGETRSYMLKASPVQRSEGPSFGKILTLQDTSYLRERSILVATLSHELKTPLTSLAAAAELLQAIYSQLGEKEKELVTSINEDIAVMSRLVDDLLALARGETGAIAIHSTSLDLGRLIRSVMRTFALPAGQKNVSMESLVEEPLPRVNGDPLKLSWVFSNLIANALRYTQAGGTITILSELNARSVRLSVKDTGIGIEPDVLDHLFERFSQWHVDGSLPGSAGLGLAIAKDIVLAHGGRMFVNSTIGQGTCFAVELPLVVEEPWHDF